MADDTRVFARLPVSESEKVRKLAQRLGHTEAQFVVHCVQGCLGAIEADKISKALMPQIVLLARRILNKDFTLGDRLVANFLTEHSKTYGQRSARWDEILLEEVNKIDSKLTPETCKAAERLAELRWAEEPDRQRLTPPPAATDEDNPGKRAEE